MKKMKLICSIGAILMTASFVSVQAISTDWITHKVWSIQATTVTTENKSTDTPYMGAGLQRIGGQDTIIFYAHASTGALNTNFDLTEASDVGYNSYGEGRYYAGSNTIGTYIRAAAQSRTFSVGSFPINTYIDFF